MDRKSLFSACAFFLIIAGCGPTTPPSNDAGPGLDAHTPPGVDAFVPGSDAFIPVDGFIPPPDAGPPGCTSDGDCNDGGDCTTDTCVIATGICRNTVTPALCAAGESCNPATGDCEMGRACATHADCADTDACTTMERCDPAARVCTFQPLDGDMDGDPPRVCGGGDCDDSNFQISSLASERCNNLDDDCDGMIDNGADAVCGMREVCTAGECVCSAGTTDCGGGCIDLSSDADHCGSCSTSCGPGGTCSSNTCSCPSGLTSCSIPGGGSYCTDTRTNRWSCGGCGTMCGATEECVDGTCVCTGGQTLCDGFCIDPQTDEINCGGCRVLCGGEGSGVCTGGLCDYLFRCPSPPTSCGGRNVCTFYDPRNCGGCGVTCPTGVECLRGVCGS